MNEQNPMFAKFDQVLGKTTPTVTSSVSSRAEEIRNIAKQSQPHEGLIQQVAPAVNSISNKLATGEINTIKALGERGKSLFEKVTSEGNKAVERGDTVPERIVGAIKTATQDETISNIAGGFGDIVSNMASPFIPEAVKQKTQDFGTDIVQRAKDGWSKVKEEWNTRPDESSDPQGARAYDVIHSLADKLSKATDTLSKVQQQYPQTSEIIKQAISNFIDIGTLSGAGETIKGAGIGAEKVLQAGAEKALPIIKEGVKTADTAISKGLGATENITNKIKRSLPVREGKDLKAVKLTEDVMTKGERLDAINEGRVKPTELGGQNYEPTATEVRASEILQGKLQNNPTKDFTTITKEIETRGKDAERYLNSNAKKISNTEDRQMFETRRAEASKYLTESELKAYDEQVRMFSKQLVGRDSFDTYNYYKALKDYEKNVADKLPRGKEALLDPTGVANAKIRAAADVRKVVRDMIGSKHADFREQMYDLMSLYDVKDTVARKVEKLTGNVITRTIKKYPKASTAIGTAVTGAAGIKLFSH